MIVDDALGFTDPDRLAKIFLEKRFTGDYAHHNLLQRPRDVPVRTAVGAMAISFYMVLTLAR